MPLFYFYFIQAPGPNEDFCITWLEKQKESGLGSPNTQCLLFQNQDVGGVASFIQNHYFFLSLFHISLSLSCVWLQGYSESL